MVEAEKDPTQIIEQLENLEKSGDLVSWWEMDEDGTAFVCWSLSSLRYPSAFRKPKQTNIYIDPDQLQLFG